MLVNWSHCQWLLSQQQRVWAPCEDPRVLQKCQAQRASATRQQHWSTWECNLCSIYFEVRNNLISLAKQPWCKVLSQPIDNFSCVVYTENVPGDSPTRDSDSCKGDLSFKGRTDSRKLLSQFLLGNAIEISGPHWRHQTLLRARAPKKSVALHLYEELESFDWYGPCFKLTFMNLTAQDM